MQTEFSGDIDGLIGKIIHRRYLITLELTESSDFLFYHGSKLYDLMCKSLMRGKNNKLGNDIIIYPAESGRIHFEKGDFYNFGLTVINAEEYFAKQLESRMKTVSEYLPKKNSLEGIFRISEIKEIVCGDIPDFISDTSEEDYTFQFLTPLRMSREEKMQGHKFFDRDYFRLGRFIELTFSRLKMLGRVCNRNDDYVAIKEQAEPESVIINLMWADMPYGKKTLGGAVGKVKIKAKLNSDTKKVLWAGQVFHTGNNTAFGFGSYFIECKENFGIDRIYPSKMLSEKLVSRENISEALEHVRSSLRLNPDEQKETENFEINLNENLKSLQDEIRTGKYKPENLNGFFIKEKEKTRALAVPAIRDRILQRAAVQILAEPLDSFLEESSYAYRKGHSRAGALKAIKSAYNQGYRYVLETDIESFFDSVDWEIMADKIDTVLMNDPMCELIKQWMKLPVDYRNMTIKRSSGLPQGSAISPLLSNLYLDEFDEMIQKNFKLIRYCDDIVILCRSKEEAEKALEEAKKSLKELLLELNISKTKITTYSEGFRYLGYLFIENEAYEISNRTKGKEKKEKRNEKTIKNWMNVLNSGIIKNLEIEGTDIYSLKEQEDSDRNEKFPIYIAGNNYKVQASKSRLYLISTEPDEGIIKIPLNSISFVAFYGVPMTTINTVFSLKEMKIPVFFCTLSGKLNMSIGRDRDYGLWYRQLEAARDDKLALEISRKLVIAKISNSRVIVMRHGKNTEALSELIKKASLSENVDSLRGIEGIAAREFFAFLKQTTENEWRFEGREKHPSADPVNAMLSFGYTIIYNRISNELMAKGLNPEIGFYHMLKPGHNALASDITEEFRFIIDSLVISMLNKNIVRKEDFEYNMNDRYPCLMTKEFRRKFIRKIEDRLSETYFFDNKSRSYIEIFEYKAENIRKIVTGKNDTYKPFLIR